ncbi:hypothetical protein [uncultured Thiodictyon sp.]|uniref:hypothetical protein n=1 Tax=uncultured Thiodictyon sp. TaxID=1846217 RepID=UPI0025E3C2B4|nr:hypothetical protein [uncultured Thiodictyon sp.]
MSPGAILTSHGFNRYGTVARQLRNPIVSRANFRLITGKDGVQGLNDLVQIRRVAMIARYVLHGSHPLSITAEVGKIVR